LFTPRPLGPLFDLADQLGGPLLDFCRAGADRDTLFRALVHQVSATQMLDVLVVEDIHWADEATLDLLRFLARRLHALPVLLIATYRDDAVGARDSLAVALGDLARQRSMRRIALAPLSADAVGALADGSDFEASELFRLTGGNPFHLTEVLQGGMGTIPVSVRDATLARAVGLGEESREVLDVAALIGFRVEVGLLESITACSVSIVDELLACGLLVADGGSLRFRHEIARLAVAQAIAPYRGNAIHGRILDALLVAGCADDARLAFHAEAAGDGVAVWRFASAAGLRAARLASHREAAAQFQRALRFASDDTDPSTVAGLYDGLADELSLADRWEEAADACERALKLWREAANRLREGDTLRRLSCVMSHLCRGGEAGAAAEGALLVLEPLGPSVELARVYAAFAAHRMLNAEYDMAAQLAVRAQEIAEPLGVLNVLSDALITQAICAAVEERDWVALMRRALEIASVGGFHEEAARAYANLCTIHGIKREFTDAERYFTQGIAFCDEHDLSYYAIYLRNERAAVLERTGRWDEALTLSRHALAETGASSVSRNRLDALIRVGLIQARRGEDDAWDHLDEANAATGATTFQMVPARLARTEAFWLEGRLAEAMCEAERAADVSAGCDGWTRGAVAIWLARTRSARTLDGDFAEPYRLELDGEWVRAAECWTRLGCSYDAAMALLGALDEHAYNLAFKTFTGLGASSAIRVVKEKLRVIDAASIPVGPRASTRAHPFGLTKRENDVLTLMVAARTNTQIAAKLGISTKTVEHHVTAILAKMGAPNRTSAVRQAIQLELADFKMTNPLPEED
jgi:DNA-binding CsgD family transcriptional regulator/tetratricopeptide (TPR) repeat protein